VTFKKIEEVEKMKNRYFFSVLLFVIVTVTHASVGMAADVLWTYQRECEYPDAFTVGTMIYRSNASGGKVHGQFGINSGYAEYGGIETLKTYHIKLRVSYSKYSHAIVPIQVKIDNKIKASFQPINQGDWNVFATTSEIDLGNIVGGVHTIRFDAAGQQWGVADLDKFTLAGYPEKETSPPLVFLPLLMGEESPWSISKNGQVLEIGYREGTSFFQYAALHLDSGYFRMVHSTDAGWGTSIIIPPAFWKDGVYYQGAPVDVTWEEKGNLLIIKLTGTLAGLAFNGQISLTPPADQSITANVTMSTSGNINVDVRPGEAFKPAMLSSMHISSTVWDTSSAFAGSENYSIPSDGWIISPPVSQTIFGLTGGTSTWKTNAPTIEVVLDRSLSITGWVTPSGDPNDDNVGFWAASTDVLTSWSYTITARP